MKITVSKDFTDAPGGRYIKDGCFSGEDFRDNYLIPAIVSTRENIIIDLDGTFGLTVSFLEETFGGLVRLNIVPLETLLQRLEFISKEDSSLPDTIRHYMKNSTGE